MRRESPISAVSARLRARFSKEVESFEEGLQALKRSSYSAAAAIDAALLSQKHLPLPTWGGEETRTIQVLVANAMGHELAPDDEGFFVSEWDYQLEGRIPIQLAIGPSGSFAYRTGGGLWFGWLAACPCGGWQFFFGKEWPFRGSILVEALTSAGFEKNY